MRLESSIRASTTPVVISGDFNAWHVAWGSGLKNHRGEALYDTIVSSGLVLLNEGNKPTFEVNNRTSIADLTLVSPELKRSTLNWMVMETESLSDHKYIRFELEDDSQHRRIKINSTRTKLDYKILEESLNSPEQWSTHERDLNERATALSSKIVAVCGRETTSRKNNTRSVHWWTPEI